MEGVKVKKEEDIVFREPRSIRDSRKCTYTPPDQNDQKNHLEEPIPVITLTPNNAILKDVFMQKKETVAKTSVDDTANTSVVDTANTYIGYTIKYV
jgi:hypothetical protein